MRDPLAHYDKSLNDHQKAVIRAYLAEQDTRMVELRARLGEPASLTVSRGGQLVQWTIPLEGSKMLSTTEQGTGMTLAALLTPGQPTEDKARMLHDIELAAADAHVPGAEGDDDLGRQTRVYEVALQINAELKDATERTGARLTREMEEMVAWVSDIPGYDSLRDSLAAMIPPEETRRRSGSARQMVNWVTTGARRMAEVGVPAEKLDLMNESVAPSVLQVAAAAVHTIHEERQQNPDLDDAWEREQYEALVDEARASTVREFKEAHTRPRQPRVQVCIARYPGQAVRYIIAEIVTDEQQDTFFARLDGWYTLRPMPPPLTARMILDETRSRKQLATFVELTNPLKRTIYSMLERSEDWLDNDEIFDALSDEDPEVIQQALDDLVSLEILQKSPSYRQTDAGQVELVAYDIWRDEEDEDF